jgi:hypothetical protein
MVVIFRLPVAFDKSHVFALRGQQVFLLNM